MFTKVKKPCEKLIHTNIYKFKEIIEHIFLNVKWKAIVLLSETYDRRAENTKSIP
ncbi:MAG: hypothetical protein GY765_37730 [bacterium]|nr:hypothetical protein [bacterium]